MVSDAIIDQCIVAGDPNPTVDLTSAEISISSTPNLTFEYFEDPSGLTPIPNPNTYPVIVNISQSVFVKAISIKGCASELVELILNVGQTTNNPFEDLVDRVCDDFIPGVSDDDDKSTIFRLDEDTIKDKIKIGIPNPGNIEVFFYENTDDRNRNFFIPDITNYRNNPTNIDITIVPNGIKFPIYYKMLSINNNDCVGIGQFYLELNQVPLNSSDRLPPIVECDDAEIDGNYINGINENIDLNQVIGTSAGQIFEGTGQDVDLFEFFFFTSEAAAFSGDTSSVDYIATPDQFTNSAPGYVIGDVVTQTIYVRIKNIATGCINPHTSFDVIINPAPITTMTILPVKVCDLGTLDGDTGNGYAQNIDISGTDFYVSDGRPITDVIITYHKNDN